MKKLKRGHTKSSDYISADHCMSAVPGRLPNTYGREKAGYTCGTFFSNYDSGKIFNFSQMSTTVAESDKKNYLESLACQGGFNIKACHSEKDIFVTKVFKADCDRQ